MRRGWIQPLQERLKLNEEQVSKLNEIYEDTGRRFEEVRKKSDAEWRTALENIHKNQVSQVEATLDAAQRAEYAKMREEQRIEGEKRRAEMDKRMREGGPDQHRGPGPGPDSKR
jgi:hypothetical protein